MGKHRFVLVPMLKISPGMLLAYQVLDPRPSRQNDVPIKGHARPGGAELYTGMLTPASKKRLIRSINLLVAISRPKKAIHFDSKKEFTFRVNFITLTLPAPQGEVSDSVLKLKSLKPWLESWKDKLPGMSYVWRAERQKNGNLHFHLITDRYIHYKDIRDSWNRCVESLGFITAFEKINGHRHPNSTDVHAVKQIRNLAAYIAKYMSKKETEGQPVQGKVWDCSRNLKAKDVCAWPMSNADSDKFQEIYEAMPYDAFSTDYCGGVRMTEKDMRNWFPEKWIKEYSSYLARIRGNEPPRV